MRAYTPDVPPDAWIIEELERLRRAPAPEQPRLELPLPALPEEPPEGEQGPEGQTPERSPGVVIIQL